MKKVILILLGVFTLVSTSVSTLALAGGVRRQSFVRKEKVQNAGLGEAFVGGAKPEATSPAVVEGGGGVAGAGIGFAGFVMPHSPFAVDKKIITESSFYQAFAVLDHQKIYDLYLESLAAFPLDSFPALDPGRVQNNQIFIDGLSLGQLEKFDQLLVPYLRSILHFQITWQENKRLPFTFASNLFDKIRAHLEERGGFYHLDMKATLDFLIEESEKIQSQPQAIFYYLYAQHMKTALMFLSGELQLEHLSLSLRPKECQQLNYLFREEFRWWQRSKKEVDGLKSKLINIETSLILLRLRANYVSQSQNKVLQDVLSSAEKDAIRTYDELKWKYQINLDPVWERKCFPLISRLVVQVQSPGIQSRTIGGQDVQDAQQ